MSAGALGVSELCCGLHDRVLTKKGWEMQLVILREAVEQVSELLTAVAKEDG